MELASASPTMSFSLAFRGRVDTANPQTWSDINDIDFCVETFYQKSSTADVVTLHSHSFYEILFITSGNVDYLLDGKRFRLQHGDIILIPPGMSHRPLFLEQLAEPYERLVLWLKADFWQQAVLDCPALNFCFEQCEKRGSNLLRTPRPTWSGLYAGFASLLKEAEQKRLGWECCVRCSALGLMAHISRTYYYQDVASPAAEQDGLLDDVFGYIDANLCKKITLGGTAEHFLVSQSTVSHLFQKRLGVSFYHCVVQRRLIAAKNAILSGMALQLAWENCGFADYTSFYRAFKKEYGLSPSEFKAQHTKKRPQAI